MNFHQKVLSLVEKIPRGRISTYKEVAKALNSKAYRAVGNILNKNESTKIPCHRVVKSNSEIGNFNRGVKRKIQLLKKENIEIENKKVKNFEKVLFRFK